MTSFDEDDDYGKPSRPGAGDDDRDLPDASDMDDPGDDDVAETVPCPYCRRPVYESADRCPSCGNYVSRDDAPSRHPRWIVAGVILCLVVIVVAWILGG
jgi:endogenous inhibitor of DNA gyrase (YacG/DUF329 family)